MPSIPLAISLGAARTGLTITANVRAVGSTSVTSVPMSEIVTGSYEGTFTSPATAATYVVELVDGTGKQYGTGSFSTDAAGNEIKLGTNAADSPATQTAQAAIAEKLDAAISTRSAPGTPQTIDQTTAVAGTSGATVGQALANASASKNITIELKDVSVG